MPKYVGVKGRSGKVGEVRCCGRSISEITYLEVTPIPDYEQTYIWIGKMGVPGILPVKHSTHLADKKASLVLTAEDQSSGKRFTIEMVKVEFSEIPRGSRVNPGEKEYDISCHEDSVRLRPELTGTDVLSKLRGMKG